MAMGGPGLSCERPRVAANQHASWQAKPPAPQTRKGKASQGRPRVAANQHASCKLATSTATEVRGLKAICARTVSAPKDMKVIAYMFSAQRQYSETVKGKTGHGQGLGNPKLKPHVGYVSCGAGLSHAHARGRLAA